MYLTQMPESASISRRISDDLAVTVVEAAHHDGALSLARIASEKHGRWWAEVVFRDRGGVATRKRSPLETTRFWDAQLLSFDGHPDCDVSEMLMATGRGVPLLAQICAGPVRALKEVDLAMMPSVMQGRDARYWFRGSAKVPRWVARDWEVFVQETTSLVVWARAEKASRLVDDRVAACLENLPEGMILWDSDPMVGGLRRIMGPSGDLAQRALVDYPSVDRGTGAMRRLLDRATLRALRPVDAGVAALVAGGLSPEEMSAALRDGAEILRRYGADIFCRAQDAYSGSSGEG